MSKKINQSNQKHLKLLIEAINCDNDDAIHLLILNAMNAIYTNKPYQEQPSWTHQDIAPIVALIKGINPKDTIEVILATQFISLHLQGTSIMAKENYNVMGHAIMMIRLSHQTLDMLQRYRGKGQTINVNYNTLNQGNAILNTVIQKRDKPKKDK